MARHDLQTAAGSKHLNPADRADGARMSIGSPDSTVGVEEHPASAEPVRSGTVAHGKSPTADRDGPAPQGQARHGLRSASSCSSSWWRSSRRCWPSSKDRTSQPFHTDLVDEFGFPTIGINGDHWLGVEPQTRPRPIRPLGLRRASVPDRRVLASPYHAPSSVWWCGLLAGFLGGWTDRIISWIIDFVLSLPYLLFAIAWCRPSC